MVEAGVAASAAEEEIGGRRVRQHRALGGPIPEAMLRDIAQESSQSERRADEAERELMEWKKIKFMEERVGEDFDGLIVSVTKFGMFVELNDLFIEGLVPLASLRTTAICITKTPGRSSDSGRGRRIPWATRFMCLSTASIRCRSGFSSG